MERQCNTVPEQQILNWSYRLFFLICFRRADRRRVCGSWGILNTLQDAATVWVAHYDSSDIEHLSCPVSCSLQTEYKSRKHTCEKGSLSSVVTDFAALFWCLGVFAAIPVLGLTPEDITSEYRKKVLTLFQKCPSALNLLLKQQVFFFIISWAGL